MTIVMKKRFSMNTKKAVSGNAAVPGDNGGEPPLECRVVKSIISANDAGKSLLELLTGRFSYHSGYEWRNIIDRGLITLNGVKAFPEAILTKGDILEYHVADIAEPEVDASYAVLYEDADILAVDKSGDLPCHPAGPFYRNTLWFILKKRYGEVFPVNRLDRETSGIVLWAKNSSAASLLAAQLASMRKRYVALVHGKFTKEIDASGFLERDNASIVRKKRCFVYNDSGSGQRAETLLRPVWWNEKYSLVEALPRTGRLHQIRATLCSLGFPLVGDKLYGIDDTFYLKIKDDLFTAEERAALLLPRQALHAAGLEFKHPRSGDVIHLESPVPAEFSTFRQIGDIVGE